MSAEAPPESPGPSTSIPTYNIDMREVKKQGIDIDVPTLIKWYEAQCTEKEDKATQCVERTFRNDGSVAVDFRDEVTQYELPWLISTTRVHNDERLYLELQDLDSMPTLTNSEDSGVLQNMCLDHEIPAMDSKEYLDGRETEEVTFEEDEDLFESHEYTSLLYPLDDRSSDARFYTPLDTSQIPDKGAFFDGPPMKDKDGELLHPLDWNNFTPHQGEMLQGQLDQYIPAFNKSLASLAHQARSKTTAGSCRGISRSRYVRNDHGTAEKARSGFWPKGSKQGMITQLLRVIKDQLDELKHIWEMDVNKVEPSLQGQLDAGVPVCTTFESLATLCDVSVKNRFNETIANLFRVQGDLTKYVSQDMRRSRDKISNMRKILEKLHLQRKRKDSSKSNQQKTEDTKDPNEGQWVQVEEGEMIKGGHRTISLEEELRRRTEQVEQLQREVKRFEVVGGASEVICPGEEITLTDDVDKPTSQPPRKETLAAQLVDDSEQLQKRIDKLESENFEKDWKLHGLESDIAIKELDIGSLENQLKVKSKEIKKERHLLSVLRDQIGLEEDQVEALRVAITEGEIQEAEQQSVTVPIQEHAEGSEAQDVSPRNTVIQALGMEPVNDRIHELQERLDCQERQMKNIREIVTEEFANDLKARDERIKELHEQKQEFELKEITLKKKLAHDLESKDKYIKELEKVVETKKRINQALELNVAMKDKEIQKYRLAKQALQLQITELVNQVMVIKECTDQDVEDATQEHAPRNVRKHSRQTTF